MTKQQLMDELVNRYEDSAMFGKSGKDAGVGYDSKSKCFSIEIHGDIQELPAKYLADHPKGGDELEQNIKHWIKSA